MYVCVLIFVILELYAVTVLALTLMSHLMHTTWMLSWFYESESDLKHQEASQKKILCEKPERERFKLKYESRAKRAYTVA